MVSFVDKWWKTLGATAAMTLCATGVSAGSNALNADFTEFPEETAAIVAATAELFETVETGKPPVPEIRRNRVIGNFITPASIAADDARFGVLTGENGPVRNLTGYRITWYPLDRLMGSVDFMGTWNGNRDLVCGFVTWDLSNPDEPLLENVTATYVNVSDLLQRPQSEAHEALLNANCAFGEIEPNFTALQPS